MQILALVLALVAAQPPATPAGPAPAITAETVAGAIRPRLPQRFSPEVALVDVAAEGNLLVMTVELSAAELASLTPAGVGRAVVNGFCAPPGARELMAGPLAVRIDSRTPGGQTTTGPAFEACPA